MRWIPLKKSILETEFCVYCEAEKPTEGGGRMDRELRKQLLSIGEMAEANRAFSHYRW